MTGTDEAIKLDVISRLYRDSRIDASKVTVEVHEGVVTIGGSVPSYRALQAAYDDARRVPGVIAVKNATSIEAPETKTAPSDEEILSRIETALRWNFNSDVSRLRLSVNNGEVIIEGSVNTYWEKVDVEGLISKMRGVTAIENRLSVVPTSRVVDEKIAGEIRAALDRDLPGEAGDIGIKVENGLVTLSGRVANWGTKTDAFSCALYTRGVVHVDDRLTVDQTLRTPGPPEEALELKDKVQNFLKEQFGQSAELAEWEAKGKGTHGAATRLKVRIGEKEENLIMKTLYPSGFGHDHFSDRGRVLLLACSNYNRMEKHVKAYDVVGESGDRLTSLKDVGEFYLFMQEAKGRSYFEDLYTILKRGSLTDLDRERARELGRFLAQVHGMRYDGEDSRILYRRRIRELIGHGECIMGLIDAFDEVDFTTPEELVDFARKSVPWWGKIRDREERLCEVHGDYHPGNIRFHDRDFTLLDRARGTWGEAADDVTCLGINYIHYAVKQTGTFEGPFSDLFRLFLQTYIEKTGDQALFELVQPFFAFRVLVLINPRFYPDETGDTRRKLLNLGLSVLETKRFETEKIPQYLERP